MPGRQSHARAKVANDRICVAVLGIYGRVKNLISEVMGLAERANLEVAALCDQDRIILEVGAKNFEKNTAKLVRQLAGIVKKSCTRLAI